MISVLPSVNAALNATAAVLLVWGYLLIRRKQIQTHRKVMLSAFVVSSLFLVCYLVYHFLNQPMATGDPKELPVIGTQVAKLTKATEPVTTEPASDGVSRNGQANVDQPGSRPTAKTN